HLVIETGKIDAGNHGNLGINIKNENETLENWVTYNFSRDVAGIDGKYVLPPVTDKILFMNGSYVINKGDKLAQLVIVPIWTPELKQVEEFESVSERGAKGFGSSGV
ncbi:TPA: dUTP pyrophosphatase, partial [Staphylococcus aureus]